MTPSSQEFAARFPQISQHCRGEDLETLVAMLVVRDLAVGDRLINEGTAHDQAYFLLEGNLTVTLAVSWT